MTILTDADRSRQYVEWRIDSNPTGKTPKSPSWKDEGGGTMLQEIQRTIWRPALDWLRWTIGGATTETRPLPAMDSTAPQELPEQIRQSIWKLFSQAKDESFEFGNESQLAQELEGIVHRYGAMAVAVIEELIFQQKADTLVASEALCVAGRIEHRPSHHERLRLLERCLFAAPVLVRRGAALGLAYLDDPRATPTLNKAIEREQIGWLRKYMRKVLVQLEHTLECQPS